MLQRLLLLKIPVRGIVQKDELPLMEHEWELITEIIDVLAPIKAISEIGSKYITMGLVYPMIRNLIDRSLKSPSSQIAIRSLKEKIRMKLEHDIKESDQEGLM